MARIQHGGIQFFYRDSGGEGIPFIFQHGLGGDAEQPFGLFDPPAGFRLLAFDCRAHGQTQPVGNPDKIHIPQFSADLNSLLDALKIEQAIVGGISMGAALALHFALQNPQRVLGLVLSRPAWLDGPMPAENRNAYGTIAQLLREYGPIKGARLFTKTDVYAKLSQRSPDVAESLLKQFHAPLAEERVIRLAQIPNDAPHPDRSIWRTLNIPTLILANKQDPIHPFRFGQQLAQSIPGAIFREISAKSVSKIQHQSDVQTNIEQFILQFLRAIIDW